MVLISYTLGFLVCVLCTYYAVKHMQAYAVVVVVLWGAFLAKPIVELLIWLVRTIRNAPLKPYQGRYYAFESRQIRIFEINQELWVVDEDVLRIIGRMPTRAAREHAKPSEHRYIASEKQWVYSQQAIMQLLDNCNLPAAAKFKHWLTTQVYSPYVKRQLGSASHRWN